MILDQLIKPKSGPKPSRQGPKNGHSNGNGNGHANGHALPRKAKKNGADDKESTDSRSVQVKSAVRPSEKPVFETLAEQNEQTLSDYIRDYLLKEAKRAGLL